MIPNNHLPIVSCINIISSDNAEDDISIYKSTLVDLLQLDTNLRELPIDYGVISTGLEYTYQNIESTRESLKRENEKLSTFVVETIQDLPIEPSEKLHLTNLFAYNREELFLSSVKDTDVKILE